MDHVVFWHIAQIGNWAPVVAEQASKLSVFPRVIVGKLGGQPLDLPDNCTVAYESAVLSEYEYPTLNLLYDHCKRHNCLVLYLHTKGVSYGAAKYENIKQFWAHLGVPDLETLQKNIVEWRRYMEHYVIGRREKCWKELEGGKDLAGVSYQNDPPHFMGNFWWARSDYIRKLSPPMVYASGEEKRAYAEYWVGSGNPKAANLRTVKHNLYLWGMPWRDYYPLF